MCRLVLALCLLPLLTAGCVSLRSYADVRRSLPAEQLVPVNGQLVHVEQAGAGEPVVLVHGFGASTWSWRKVMPELARSRRVIALDLSGFGFTERPADPTRYTRDGQVALILGVLDALKIERAHLVGHSYGGALSLRLAAHHPERLRSLLLVDSAAPTYPNDRRRLLAGWRWLDSLLVRGLALRPGGVRRALEASVYDNSLVTPEMVAGYLDRARIEGVVEAYYGLTAPARAVGDKGQEIDLAQIAVPTLVLWGRQDELIPIADGQKAAERIPGARFEVLEKTGHMPMEERPEDFLRIAQRFWDGVEAQPAP